MECRLRIYPDPVLRKKAVQVQAFDKGLVDLVDEMRRILRQAGGIGLAAPQVGVSERVILVRMNPLEENATEDVRCFVNPEIVETQGVRYGDEGCLSIPGITAEVKRFSDIKLRARDEKGREISLETKDLVAVIFQHEIDHLDGILFVDRLSPAGKLFMAGALRKLRKKNKEKNS